MRARKRKRSQPARQLNPVGVDATDHARRILKEALRAIERGERAVVVYDQAESIDARKGQPHACNAKCKAGDHRYRHRYSARPKFPIVGLPNGYTLI